MILLARGTCGIGFIGLCVNAMLPEPSLLAIYLLGLWDGFFASLGVTALLAATPALVGRKSDAGRRDYHADGTSGIGYFADVGGILLASGGVAWNYGLAAAGTFITLLPLLTLPRLPVPPQPRENPFIALLAAFRFCSPVRLSAVLRCLAAW